jgi:hypothetical protein
MTLGVHSRKIEIPWRARCTASHLIRSLNNGIRGSLDHVIGDDELDYLEQEELATAALYGQGDPGK